MKLNVTGFKEKMADMGPADNGTYNHIGSQGGTERMYAALYSRLDEETLAPFNIICSRVRPGSVKPDKTNILWLHDTWDDPESEHLADPESRKRFGKLVFVSNHQQATFNMGRDVPFQDGVVLQNAIEPFPEVKKPTDGPIRLIYHTTPHRGLELLVPVFEKVCEIYPDVHLDVFSSFKIYGWEQRDADFAKIFARIKSHPNMTYHGFQPNDVVRTALLNSHIYAYPNIWPETSCISVIEAMSAGCEVVCPNFGALPETCANFASMYGWEENPNRHANVFASVLLNVIRNYRQGSDKRQFQKTYFDAFYNWDLRARQWDFFLRSLRKGA